MKYFVMGFFLLAGCGSPSTPPANRQEYEARYLKCLERLTKTTFETMGQCQSFARGW